MKKTTNRRYLDLAIGILAALVGFVLAGCDGGSADGVVDVGAGTTADTGRPSETGGVAGSPDGGGLLHSSSGVAYCNISAAAASAPMVSSQGQPTATTMGSYYTQAALDPGHWGVVTTPSAAELKALCLSEGHSTKQCVDLSTLCLYTQCSMGTDPATGKDVQTCQGTAAYGTLPASSSGVVNTAFVGAALCSTDGQFVGWLCVCRVNSQGISDCPAL